MVDRSSRPHSMPTKTPPAVVKQIVKARWRRRLGPVRIAGELGIPASTVHAVLMRCWPNRLSRIDRVTGEPIRRYEHDHPVSLIHVDVTKFGNIPDGGGTSSSAGNRAEPTRSERDLWECAHVPGQVYDGQSVTRVITKARLFDVSLVDRPDFPDARIMSQPVSRVDMETRLGSSLPVNARPVCGRCMAPCPGI